MKKLFLSLAVFVMAICANAQTNQYFWYNGHLMLGSQISSVDSITFGEEETDSIMLYLPRTVTKVVYDTIYQVFRDTIYKNENEINADYQCENSIASGDCSRSGSNVTWSLCEDSVIIFEGSGEMEGYPNFSAPWYSHISDFHTAILKEGIENLGYFTLVGPNLKTLILPQTLKKIEGLACHGANKLTTMAFPDSLEYIGERAFLDCAFESITIPASVHTIGGGAFQGCTKLKTVYVQSSTPVWAGYDIFINVYDAIIYVPRGSLQAYQNANGWRDHASQMREYDYSPSKPETPTIIHDTIYITIHDTVCPDAISDGALPSEFSVSETKKVRFSKGNLQFNPALGSHKRADGTESHGTWRFAENQYDFVGDDIQGNVYYKDQKCTNSNITETTDSWFDLFCWATSGWDNTAVDEYATHFQPWCNSVQGEHATYNPFGYGPSTTTGETNIVSISAYYDWGIYNAISNGGNIPNNWRTLTASEWVYLFQTRPQANHLWSQANVCGVNGVILLPDNWKNPDGTTFTYQANNYSTNIYSAEQWASMQNAGAVFFPANGRRHSTNYYERMGDGGQYWSTTCGHNMEAACDMYFETGGLNPRDDYYWASRQRAACVRLVQDVE